MKLEEIATGNYNYGTMEILLVRKQRGCFPLERGFENNLIKNLIILENLSFSCEKPFCQI